MADDELAEWGRKEDQMRQAEMQEVNSGAELEFVQKACAVRRKQVGLSAGQAARWVRVGQRLDRGDSLSFAMRR